MGNWDYVIFYSPILPLSHSILTLSKVTAQARFFVHIQKNTQNTKFFSVLSYMYNDILEIHIMFIFYAIPHLVLFDTKTFCRFALNYAIMGV